MAPLQVPGEEESQEAMIERLTAEVEANAARISKGDAAGRGTSGGHRINLKAALAKVESQDTKIQVLMEAVESQKEVRPGSGWGLLSLCPR